MKLQIASQIEKGLRRSIGSSKLWSFGVAETDSVDVGSKKNPG